MWVFKIRKKSLKSICVYIKVIILYNFICKILILLRICYDAQYLGLVSKAQQ